MPRQLSVKYRGAIHHIMSRGDRREDIFADEVDRQDLLKTVAEACQKKLGEHHAGALRRETAELKAERIVAEEWRRLGWTEADLARRHKSDPAKLELATRLRRETTLTVKAIAAPLHLGTSKTARRRLQQRKGEQNANQVQMF